MFRVLALDGSTSSVSMLSKLRSELDELGEDLDIHALGSAKYTDAVVSEALRLLNPLPTGIQAVTPPEGLEIAGVSVPGNVAVRVPHAALMSDERYFPRGGEFIPERWTGERPELLGGESRRAWVPFGVGVHHCVGKNLAMNEMRLVLARVVREFDVELGESYNEEKWKREWKDHIIMEVGALWLKFTPRVR